MGTKIAICDDEKVEIEYLSSLVKRWGESKNENIHITSFSDAESFLFDYSDHMEYEILLLDIQMRELNGIELAKKIREKNKAIQIIFITGFPDFIAEGYEVSALHYLMKPVKEEKLLTVLDKALENLNHTEMLLPLVINGETHYIPFIEIRYIEAQGHYIIINSKSREYRTKMNLSEIQKLLNKSFFRCQRSFIVNLIYVRKITRTLLILNDATEIPLSRNLYKAANLAIVEYFS